MRSSVIARLIILGSIAILSTLFIQFYIIHQQQRSEENDFRNKAVTALYNVARRLVKDPKQLPPTNKLIARTESNYFVVNINDQINVNLLEAFLNAEFHTIGLHENFLYGIYDCDKNNMLYGKLVSFDQSNINKKPSRLPVYKDFTYYFVVRFVDRVANPFYAYTWASLALLLLTLLFFAYSLWVILKQRSLAEMQKDFINNLTHEFKTPIAAVGISSDVLLQNDVINEHPRLKQYAEIIKKQNQLLNTQVERVLQVARMEKTNFQINPEPIDTHEIIKDLVSSVEPRVKAKNGDIALDLQAMAPVISADKIHFIHIIQNILDNAIKYSTERIKIDLSTYDLPDKMVIKCADQGPGIPREYQKKIFSRFYRVPTGNVHNVKGFGLGLHYVYQICRAHGWKIRVESKIGVGTNLYIEIPK
jgi:two-component system, OmpR family, phosphate regulon sensor histidine kinase PhoR